MQLSIIGWTITLIHLSSKKQVLNSVTNTLPKVEQKRIKLNS